MCQMNSSQRSASKKKENFNEIGAFPHFWVKEVELRLKIHREHFGKAGPNLI